MNHPIYIYIYNIRTNSKLIFILMYFFPWHSRKFTSHWLVDILFSANLFRRIRETYNNLITWRIFMTFSYAWKSIDQSWLGGIKWYCLKFSPYSSTMSSSVSDSSASSSHGFYSGPYSSTPGTRSTPNGPESFIRLAK